MATVSTKPVSSIAMAFAGQSASVDIPKPRDLDAVTDHGKHDAAGRGRGLPTPPNSISPNLPPHQALAPPIAVVSHTPPNLESDIDLREGNDAAKGGQPLALSSAALSGLEVSGAITPTLLAKHHLPDIMLSQGPLAIRNILGCLTQQVPGFSRIPSAKARRLVVAALESRGGGGLNGEVDFEKVGWGRWEAKPKGQASQERTDRSGSQTLSAAIPHEATNGVSPPPSMPDSYAMSNSGGMQIPKSTGRWRSGKRDFSRGSWAGDSMLSSRDEEMFDMNMAEHEADKMSLDGDEFSSSSPSYGERAGVLEDVDEATDEEDWEHIGPDALRRGSLPAAYIARKNYNHLSISASRMRSIGTNKHSYSRRASSHSRYPSRNTAGPSHSHSHNGGTCDVGSFGVTGHDSQEREAIQALLSMGSM